MTNPYQSPGEPISSDSEAGQSTDPLRFPALGCFVMAVVGFLVSVLSIVVSLSTLRFARQLGNEQVQNAAWNQFISAWIVLLLCILAVLVARAMARRRHRWLVVASSLLGIVVCVPAPLAVLILLRLRRKEVWDSFESTSARNRLGQVPDDRER